ICGILKHVDSSTAHDGVRRLVDFEVKLSPDHPGKTNPQVAGAYGRIQPEPRQWALVVEPLSIAQATPSLPSIRDERLICLRKIRLAVVMAPREGFNRSEIAHCISKMLRRVPQFNHLGRLRDALGKLPARLDEGRVEVCGDRRNENGFRKKGDLQVRLRALNKVGKVLDRHRERDVVPTLTDAA